MKSRNPNKLQAAEGNEQYYVKMSNMLAALKNLDHSVDINGLGENIETSAEDSPGFYEVKQHKSWFHEGCSKFVYKRT
jgi:hypothetical protein